MAFKYKSLGTDKSLEEVARNALAKIHGPKGALSDEEEDEEQRAKAKGTRRGTPKKAPAKAYKKQKEDRDDKKTSTAQKETSRDKSRARAPTSRVSTQDFDKDAPVGRRTKSRTSPPPKNVTAPFDD